MAYNFGGFVSGECFDINIPTWVELLNFARAYGWEPQGTALYDYAPGHEHPICAGVFLDYTPDKPCTTATFSAGQSSPFVTVPVVPVAEWNGDYTANNGQVVTGGDALALGEAVARGLAVVSELPEMVRGFFARFATFARNSGGFYIF